MNKTLAIQHITNQILNIRKDKITITQKQYDQWHYEYIFDALDNVRFGESFCNHFNIIDYILAYTLDIQYCKDYIKKIYIKAIKE